MSQNQPKLKNKNYRKLDKNSVKMGKKYEKFNTNQGKIRKIRKIKENYPKT